MKCKLQNSNKIWKGHNDTDWWVCTSEMGNPVLQVPHCQLVSGAAWATQRDERDRERDTSELPPCCFGQDRRLGALEQDHGHRRQACSTAPWQQAVCFPPPFPPIVEHFLAALTQHRSRSVVVRRPSVAVHLTGRLQARIQLSEVVA